MTQYNDRVASQDLNSSLIVWGNTYATGSGTAQAKLDDVTIDY